MSVPNLSPFRRHLAPLAGIFVMVAGCTFEAAGFGHPCADDGDCASLQSSESLLCNESRCVTQAFLDASADPDPDPDPDPLAGERCNNAIPLAIGDTVQGTTSGALDDHNAICGGAQAADVAYVIAVPEVSNLVVRLDASFDGLLYAALDDDSCLFDALLPGACQTNDDDDDVVTLSLPGVGPGNLFIVVDGDPPALGENAGSYSLTVREDVGCEAGFVAVKNRCLGIQKTVNQVEARTNPVATLLDDGRVLITGGRQTDEVVPTATAEIFDPTTDTFAATTPMNTPRGLHAAVLLNDGRVLVAGGLTDNSGTRTASVEVWDPVNESWSNGPPLPRRRDLLSLTQLAGGDGILAVGGRDGATTLGDVLVLDVGLTAWTAQEPLDVPRFGHLAFLIDNGDEVVIIGGRRASNQEAIDDVATFTPGNPNTGTLDAIPEPRAAACGALVSQTRVMLFGGYQGSNDTEFAASADAYRYVDDGEGWTEIFDVMTEPRLFATASAVPGVGIVVAGGSQDNPTASVDLYDDDDESFVSLPPLRNARLAHAAVTLQDGRVLIVGGDGGDEFTTIPLDVAEIIGPEVP